MLTTNDVEWDSLFRRLRQHSMSVPDTVRHGASEVIYEEYRDVGFNYRMTDIQAAVGCAQLKRLPEIVGSRRMLASRYRELLSEIPELGMQVEPCWARSNWQSFCVRLPEGCDQRKVMQHMLDAGVATRRGVMCSHREMAYPRNAWGCGARSSGCDCGAGMCRHLWHSEDAQDRTIMLPLFPAMTVEQQHRVVEAMGHAVRNSGEQPATDMRNRELL
jgi:perosamine synthetase